MKRIVMGTASWKILEYVCKKKGSKMSDMGCDSFERGERLAAKAERTKIAHEEKEKQVKWVVSKYAPETGEKFEVLATYDTCYRIRVRGNGRDYNLDVPKSEYIPTTPPERWETVPNCYWKVNSGRDQAWLHCGILSHESETQVGPLELGVLRKIYRFDIQAGALVLQRKVSS